MGEVPALQGMVNDAGHMTDPSRATAHKGTQQTFGGEQHHLCVIGDSTQYAIGGHEFRNTTWAELCLNVQPIEKLHRCAQGIPYRAA
ncbi:hypothetical protein FQZ97_636300 [compost metagenome]